jgi:hypothetical protein
MARAFHSDGPDISLWFRRLTLTVLALYMALSAYVLWRAAVLTPFADEIDWIERWRALQVDGDWAWYLLAPVNHHRLPWLFGLLAWDIQAFGGSNAPLIISAALSLGAMAWLLGREAGKAAPPPLALPAVALAVMLTLTAASVLDASTPICANYTHGAVFAVLALLLAEGGPRDGLNGRRAAALLVAMAAGLGDAVALAVWPVLTIGAVRRRDWPWLTAVLVTGAVFVGLYAFGQGDEARSSTQVALQDPLGALRLALNYLTLPWTRLSLGLAWIGGLLIAVAGLAGVVICGGRQASRAERLACSFILFSLGTAAMAGLGRAGQPDALNVPLRYTVLLAPLQVGLLMLALPYAGAVWRANRGLTQALLAALLVLVAAQNAVMAMKVIRASDVVRTTLADFRNGQRTPQMLVLVYPDLAHAAQVYDGLQRDGLFQHELHLKPQPPSR